MNTTMDGMTRRSFMRLMAIVGATGASVGLFGCGSGEGEAESSASTDAPMPTGALALDSTAWGYDADNGVYYQIGVQYCENPQAPSYESMGIYVPAAYFDGKDNGDGTFTCSINASGTVNGYTAATAPIVMPINTAGYSAQAAPTEYSANGLSDYLAAGFVYVFAGCRGRQMSDDACGAAPWGVTDLKAAVRTLRYNRALLPGNTDRIFSLGMSGGGAQSAVLGASGDAEGYDDYLAKIGAPAEDSQGNALSDAIFGSMCWCPITNLDMADAAYEWNMGQFADSGTRAEGTFTRQLSRDLAARYADYINGLGLKEADGTALSLKEGGEGIFTAGTYYDKVKALVEESLNNFLADTKFPYTPSNSFNADMGAGGGMRGGMGGQRPDGERPDMASGSFPDDGNRGSGGADGAGFGGEGTLSDSTESKTYATVADYIAALNGDSAWIEYDESTNTATITGLAGFVAACKSPSKDVGAFDALDRSQAENQVFGDDSTSGLHFDAAMADLLSANADAYAKLENWDSGYPEAYESDRAWTDELGRSSDERQNIYNPMYYVCDAYQGSSTPAAHWRIRTGINQGDTASTTELNLALALESNGQVSDVDFATVWGQGHTMAERTGSSTENFITWVNSLCQ